MNKLTYEEPKVEIITFESADVLDTSDDIETPRYEVDEENGES